MANPKTPAHLDHVEGSAITLAAVAQLVAAIRPDWPSHLVASVLNAHSRGVHLGDLTIAAIRAAQDPTYQTPRTIGWRGPHWRGLGTMPADVAPRARCSVCGKIEPRCATERPGLGDDHEFAPVRRDS